MFNDEKIIYVHPNILPNDDLIYMIHKFKSILSKVKKSTTDSAYEIEDVLEYFYYIYEECNRRKLNINLDNSEIKLMEYAFYSSNSRPIIPIDKSVVENQLKFKFGNNWKKYRNRIHPMIITK